MKTGSLERHAINVLRVMLATIVAAGPLALLDLWFDRTAVVLAVVSVLGVLGLAAEGKRLFSGEEGDTDRTA